MQRRNLISVIPVIATAGLASACGAPEQAGPGETSRSAPGASSTPNQSAAPPASSPATTSSGSATPSAPSGLVGGPQLPGGGRSLSKYRFAGYSGYPGAPGQGRLGIGDLEDRVVEMKQRFNDVYGSDRTVMPTMELIATTVHPKPGADGMFRTRAPAEIVDEHQRVAKKQDAYLLLNIQPGRAAFIDEVKAFERWLVEPNVGVALDPEWAVKAGQIPGRVYGSTTGAALDTVAKYLSELVAKHNLPEKAMVYHQLHLNIVREETKLRTHPGVVLIKSIDGIGSPGAKVDTWKKIVAQTPNNVQLGFKLFYEEDVDTGGRIMTPQEVMALKPKPVYVLYE